MEYRGVEYQVVQGINGGKWKWWVQLSGRRNHGEARRRDDALGAAKKAIDRSLEPKKVRLRPR
jgi:hypothetical protein